MTLPAPVLLGGEETLSRLYWRIATHVRDRFLDSAWGLMDDDGKDRLVECLRDCAQNYRRWANQGLASHRGARDVQAVAPTDRSAMVDAHAELIGRAEIDFLASLRGHGSIRANVAAREAIRRLVGCYIFSVVQSRDDDQHPRQYLRFAFVPDEEWLKARPEETAAGDTGKDNFSRLFGYLSLENTRGLLHAWKRAKLERGEADITNASEGFRSLQPAIWHDIAQAPGSPEPGVDYTLGHRGALVWPVGREAPDPRGAPPAKPETRALFLFVSPVRGLLQALLKIEGDVTEPLGWPAIEPMDFWEASLSKALRASVNRELGDLLTMLSEWGLSVTDPEYTVRDHFGVTLKHKLMRLEFVCKRLRDLAEQPGPLDRQEVNRTARICAAFIDSVLGTIEYEMSEFVSLGRRDDAGMASGGEPLGRYVRSLVRSDLSVLPHVIVTLDDVVVASEPTFGLPPSQLALLTKDVRVATQAINGLVFNAYEHNGDYQRDDVEGRAGNPFRVEVAFDTMSQAAQGRVVVTVSDNGRRAALDIGWRTWLPRWNKFMGIAAVRLRQEYGTELERGPTEDGYSATFCIPIERPRARRR